MSVFWNRYQYFQEIFTDIWPAADIWLATDTNISKFAYQYFYQYFFNEVVWLKLVQIAYSPDLG